MARILVVDDEPVVHEILGRYLVRYEHETVHAEDGEAALDLLRQQQVDAVIADIRMPRMDGFQLLTHIRRDWPDVPVVVISGHGDDNTERQALSLGAAAFVTKPLRLGELTDLVSSLLSTGAT